VQIVCAKAPLDIVEISLVIYLGFSSLKKIKRKKKDAVENLKKQKSFLLKGTCMSS
jgi:hypothetical protein